MPQVTKEKLEIQETNARSSWCAIQGPAGEDGKPGETRELHTYVHILFVKFLNNII